MSIMLPAIRGCRIPATALVACSLLLLLLGSSEAARATPRRTLMQGCSTFCTGKADGLYANPCDSQCKTYLQCGSGITYQMSCSTGTVFNPTARYCDWPYNYACPGTTSTPSPSLSPLASPAPSPIPSPVASPVPSPVRSPAASPVQSPTPTPTPSPSPSPATACSSSTFCASHADGLYANPCDPACTTYIQCSHSTTYTQNCGTGLVFNPTRSYCDWPYNYACPGTTGPLPSTTPSASPAPSPTPSPVPSPSPKSPVASPSPTPTPAPAPGTTVFFSQYKDVGINMNWNTYIMSTQVKGSLQNITSVMPANNKVLTWAFATGTCGAENWAGISRDSMASNVAAFVNAGKQYILSTGGAAGSFTCSSDAGFQSFIQKYLSANLVGVDFDIEAGQSQADIDNLVARVKVAKAQYPNLRWSFTLATLGGSPTLGNMLGSAGQAVMNSIAKQGLSWNNVYINLMTMDYGSAGPYVCAVASGKCDMAQSAINAVESVRQYYSVPYSNIEITPMIGGNDVIDETFTIANAQTVAAYAKSKGVGGVHFWSLDRDRDCAPGYASSTCNTYGQAGTLGFTNTFLSALA